MATKLVSETLRDAIERSGLSQVEIGRRAGIDRATLSRFVRRERGLSQPAIDALAKLFGLELSKKRTRDER